MNIGAREILDTLPRYQLENMIDSNTSCKGMIVGYEPEQVLMNNLLGLPQVISLQKIPDQDKQKGDVLVKYRDPATDAILTFTIEVKCVRSKTGKEPLLDGGTTGQVYVGFSDSTQLEDGTRTSCVLKGAFDVLAICMVTVTGKWDYYFIHSKYLPSSDKYPDRIKANLSINTLNTPCLHSDIARVIQDLN